MKTLHSCANIIKMIMYKCIIFLLSSCYLSESDQAYEHSIEDIISRNVLNMENVSFSELWSEYIKVCPFDMCTDDVNDRFVFQMNTALLSHCTSACSCYPNCMLYKICCPGVWYGYLDYECVSTTLFGVADEWFNMIGNCPGHIVIESNETKPVTSERTGLTYKNVFIAKCNGESGQLITWVPSVVCYDSDIYVFRVKDFTDIYRGLQTGFCAIRYIIPDNKLHLVPAFCAGHEYQRIQLLYRFPNLMSLIGSCNVTGKWKLYNNAIDSACQRLDFQFHDYKNPFCYICNPGLSVSYYGQTPLVTECNITGGWYIFDKEIYEGCLYGNETSLYLPFKNVFCRLCNNFTPFRGKQPRPGEIWIRTEFFPISLMAETFRKLHLPKFVYDETTNYEQPIMPKSDPKNNSIIGLPVRVSSRHRNMSILTFNWDIYYNIPVQCELTIDFDYLECNMSNSECTELIELTSCAPENVRLEGASKYDCARYFEDYRDVINDLKYFKYDQNISLQTMGAYLIGFYFCSDSVIPNEYCNLMSAPRKCLSGEAVEINRYSSFYCLFCNSFYGFENAFMFDINIKCKQPIDTWLIVDTISLLEASKGCEVVFVPSGVHDARTKQWDECIDIPWLGIYCTEFGGRYTFGTYRKLFSMTDESWNSILEPEASVTATTDICDGVIHNSSTIEHDENCQVLSCSRNHVLVNGSCVSNYSTYGYLLYLVEYAFVVTEHERIDNYFHDIHSTTLKAIGDFVLNALMLNLSTFATADVHEISVKADGSCRNETDDTLLQNGSFLHMELSIIIYFTNNVTKVEEYLVDTLDSIYTIYSVDRVLKLTPSQDAFDFQYILECFYQNKVHIDRPFGIDDMDFENLLKVIEVNRFLLCPMIEFESLEFKRINGTRSFFITKTKLVISENMFLIFEDKILLCYTDYLLFMKTKVWEESEKNVVQIIYEIADLTLSILSLICLGISLLIYCLFRDLRTAQDKNNINLIFCLFGAQLSLKLGIWQHTSSLLCPMIGIVIHFFWIAIFCSMNICSLQIYCIFRWSNISVNIMSHKRMCLYCTYIYMVPLFCITITVCCHLLLSSGQSIGYGEKICFLTDRTTSILAFITPSVVLFFANGVMFTLTYISIKKTLSNTQSVLSAERQSFFIYLCLWIILGVTWLLLIIDSIFEMTLFSFLALAFRTLQCVFPFIYFVLNRRVFILLRNRLCSFGKPPIEDRANDLISQ